RGGGGRVADACRVVDVVRAEEAHQLLRDVVGLVREPTRGQVERESLGAGLAHAGGYQLERVVPGDATEPTVAFLAQHRVRQTTELTQLLAAEQAQRRDVREHGGVE